MKLTEKEFRQLYNDCFITKIDMGINFPVKEVYSSEGIALKQAVEKGYIEKERNPCSNITDYINKVNKEISLAGIRQEYITNRIIECIEYLNERLPEPPED